MEEAKSQILLWTVPDCPLRVTVAAPIINEIRILAVEAFYSVPRGGVEIGGVFFGSREPAVIHIRAHRTISCQYSTGPSFTLSVKDQLGLSGLLDQASADPELTGMVPLGWYHSHNRSEIFLSPVDLQLYNEFFPDRWQIAMVLRPANLQPTRAGIFFRDRLGAVKSDSPVQIFTLEPPAFGLTLLNAEPTADAAPPSTQVLLGKLVSDAPPAPVTPPAFEPEADTFAARLALLHTTAVIDQPVVQPVALRPVPQTPAITPAPVTASDVVPVAATLVPVARVPIPDPPSLVSAASASTDNGSRNSSVAVMPAPSMVDLPPQPAIIPIAEELADDVALPNFLNRAHVPAQPRSISWLWVLIAIILACGAGGAAAFKWGRLAKPADLGLETYDINGAFLIRWDRESNLIRNATHATLEIQDGGEKTPFPLNRTELAAGGYGYIRRTGQVSVHLVVEGPTPAEEYSNFSTAQALGSQPAQAPEKEGVLAQALKDNEHLKTELINESMQSLELRRDITSLRRQLAEERARKKPRGPSDPLN